MTDLELALFRTSIGLLTVGLIWLIGTVVRRGVEIAEMRQQIAHLPNRECTEKLALSIEALGGEIKSLGDRIDARLDAGSERMERGERDIERMERWLYERGL